MKDLQKKIQKQLQQMASTNKLFRSSIPGSEVWKTYLESFEDDPIFRDPNSTTHNCNLCNNFIRRYGNIVAISPDNKIMTIWDVEIEGEFKPVVAAISAKLKAAKIQDVFFETFTELNGLNYEKCKKTNTVFRLGIDKNHKQYNKEEAEKFGVVKEGEIRTFDHLHVDIPTSFVDQTGKSVESIMGEYRDAKNVFQRAMEEISLDTLYLVKDLINQGSLLDGTTHLYKVEQFIPLKKEYDELAKKDRDNWCWNNSYKLPFAKFKNELIGVLCSELSEGKELNDACQAWNKRVDPANYMKAIAPITKKQIEEAKKFVEENGYEESFDRRFATIDDIKVNEILHANTGDGKLKKVSVFDNVKSTSTRHKRSEFDKVEEVSIEKFMKDILPTCTGIEAFLTSQQEGNMVSLTTANNPNSKPIFKWNNNFSWTFNGNLAGKSQIKEAVKSRGGNVEGVLRFSQIWNDGDGRDNSDLDAWCTQPDNVQIGYNTGYRKDRGGAFTSCGGQLDLDNTSPSGRLAVENIYFRSQRELKNGVYKFYVNQFSARNSQGFKAEIEFDGEIYNYEYNRPVSGKVLIATVTHKDGRFTIEHGSTVSVNEGLGAQKEIYGLPSNEFHKVNLVCLSPNHWEGNNVGNKHYFFMLEGAKSPLSIRSFHNENLIPELLAHRKVMEVLGTQTMVEPTGKQLSGLGFNATVKDEVILRLQGTHKRVVKVRFEGLDTKSETKKKALANTI
jgi:hypothetical protein